MDFDTIRPIISGLIGGAIATYFCTKWSKDLPVKYNGKSQEVLLKENRFAIKIANTIFLISLFAGVLVYQIGLFKNNDWRGFGLCFGFALFAPLVCLIAFSFSRGSSRMAEAMLAYSINQKMPVKLLMALLILGTILFFVTCINLIT